MSTYEDYNRISASYDATRWAFGCDVIRKYLSAYHCRPVRWLADVGCGTGNYAVALRESALNVLGCDLSLGMLTIAKSKQTLGGNPSLVRCDIGTSLPFRTETVDVVTCIQVLHHLDDPGDDYPKHRKLLSEVCRVLSNGGLLIVNTVTHDQLRDGVWWGELTDLSVDRMIPRFAPLSTLCAMADECGLEVIEIDSFRETTTQNEEYLDYRSIRSQRFRDGDSNFSLLSAEELQIALSRLDAMESSGAIGPYLAKREQLRHDLGQSTFLLAIKQRTC